MRKPPNTRARTLVAPRDSATSVADENAVPNGLERETGKGKHNNFMNSAADRSKKFKGGKDAFEGLSESEDDDDEADDGRGGLAAIQIHELSQKFLAFVKFLFWCVVVGLLCVLLYVVYITWGVSKGNTNSGKGGINGR